MKESLDEIAVAQLDGQLQADSMQEASDIQPNITSVAPELVIGQLSVDASLEKPKTNFLHKRRSENARGVKNVLKYRHLLRGAA